MTMSAAARALATAQAGRRRSLEAIGRLISARSGDDELDFNGEAINFMVSLSNELALVEEALTHLIDADALDKARQEREDTETEDRIDPMKVLDKISAITLASRETARASSYVDIRFPDGTTLRWTTKNPLLGPAIEAAFTPRLEQGQDLFITDVVLTPQGKQSAEKIVIPAHTRRNHPGRRREPHRPHLIDAASAALPGSPPTDLGLVTKSRRITPIDVDTARLQDDHARLLFLDRVPRLVGLLGRERGASLGGVAFVGCELFDVRAIKRICIPDFCCGSEVSRCDEAGDMTLGDAEKSRRFGRPNKTKTGHSANCSFESSGMSTFGPAAPFYPLVNLYVSF